jgi:uridine kinase
MYEREVAGIVSELADRGSPAEVLIGIDGPGGAGKSTLARELGARIDAEIVQADDFHRPRGERGVSGAGQTYDWRRLERQVLEPFKAGELARYQRYDWERDALAEWRDVPPGPVIVEGIYVLREEARPYFDYSIWIDAPRSERLRRGLARDGIEARRQWNEWMELEDEYVRAQRPDRHADRRVDGAPPSPKLRR